MTNVFDHPWLGGLFGDDEMSRVLSAEAELARMLAVESAWTRAIGKAQGISADVYNSLAETIVTAPITPQDLRDGAARDGIPVPALVELIKRDVSADLHPLVHKGLTSQDVMDTSLMLALQRVFPILGSRLGRLLDALGTLNTRFGARSIMGYTRMQAALPITVGDRISGWERPLAVLQDRMPELAQRAAIVQWGGPVGIRDGGTDALGASFAANLGLRDPGHAWHSDRLIIADIAAALASISSALGKIGQDLTLMAQMGPACLVLQSGGGSSAMQHKRNPVLAETLVTLARFNASAIGSIHHAVVHEQERSGSAWALEWMTLPDMIMTTGRSLTCASQAIAQIDRIGQDS